MNEILLISAFSKRPGKSVSLSKKRFFSVLFFFIIFTTVKSQNILLWNGETPDINNCVFEYGNADNSNSYAGQWCFKGLPDKWHKPAINLKCQGTWRIDLSQHDEIWFYVKSNNPATSFKFSVGGWPHMSNAVDIAPYISGGSLSNTYKLVKIPIAALKTADYKLNWVETLFFDTSTVSNQQIYIDEIVAVDLYPNKIDNYDILSEQAVKLNISSSYDTTTVKNILNYSLQSNNDIDFATPIYPSKVGMHYYVVDFPGFPENPIVKHELFLFFDKKMKNGKNYQLTINDVKDRAGNSFTAPQQFSIAFSDNAVTGSVKANQVGYLPTGPKYGYLGNYLGAAGVMECNPASFQLRDAVSNQTVYTGIPTLRGYDPVLSGEKVYECDFSGFTTPGTYYLYSPGLGKSYNFKIKSDVYETVYNTLARGLYYQRCGTALKIPYADLRWTHGACHLNDGYPHASQANSPLYNGEPLNTLVPMPGGWHDAGDYGKYSVTAVQSLYYLFTSYQFYPQKYIDNELNIPESGNGVPDVLDEAKWEIDWLKQMQAPDGGVYDRVTTIQWGSPMPEFNNDPRYIAEKTTFATALYAAIMSMAYRNFLPYWPQYANDCLVRAEKAWQFLEGHPNVTPLGGYFPKSAGMGGGDYPDPDGDVDDRAFAAAELYKSTGKIKYHEAFKTHAAQHPPMWGWNDFQHHQKKAYLCYATTTQYPVDANLIATYKTDYKNYLINDLIPRANNNLYRNSYRSDVLQWIGWGSFTYSAQYSWDFIIGSYLSNDPAEINSWLNYAKINLNSQLGANPQNICYITGVGSKYPKDPLHTPSIHDGVDEPVPGIPVLGPFAHLSAANLYDKAVQDPANLYPKGEYEFDSYPILRRYYDNHENVGMSEFSIAYQCILSSAYSFFKEDKCQAPASTSISNITPYSALISWSAVTGTSLYTIEYRKLGTVSWSTISTSNTSQTINNLSPATTYQYRVRAGCLAYSGIKTFTTINYCSSRGIYTNTEYIDLVKFGEINNPSGNNGGYKNNTNLSTEINLGDTYTIQYSAYINSWFPRNEYWRIWIDYNRDGDFNDAGELVAYKISGSSGTLSSTFTVPQTAGVGPTRMRVSMKYNSSQSPCEQFTNGEVEDYTVILGPYFIPTKTVKNSIKEESDVSEVLKVNPNPVRNQLYIKTNKTFKIGDAIIFIQDITGKEVMRTIYKEQQIDVSSLPSGIYMLIIKQGDIIQKARFIVGR